MIKIGCQPTDQNNQQAAKSNRTISIPTKSDYTTEKVFPLRWVTPSASTLCSISLQDGDLGAVGESALKIKKEDR